MTRYQSGIGKNRSFALPPISSEQVQFLAESPMSEAVPFAERSATGVDWVLEASQRQRSRFQPLPPATGVLPYRLSLDSVLLAEEIGRIRDSELLVTHAVGDSGGVRDGVYQREVAHFMARDFSRPRLQDRPAFFFHLGDVVYFRGEADQYYPQFYDAYEHYPAPIFAIPGNHDGESSRQAESLAAFVSNFCGVAPAYPPDALDIVTRDTMTQPNVYFTLECPLVTIVGLYSNVPEGGEIHDDQIDWFIQQLRDAPLDRALLVAVHHPLFSADTHHSGSPEILRVFKHAILTSGRSPDLVLTGHVHNYQRFTWQFGAHEIPVIVAGAGGYPNLHELPRPNGEPIHTPFRSHDADVTLESYKDDRHGFLRLEISPTRVVGKYYALPERARDRPNRVDLFQLDLGSHRMVGN